MVQATQTESRQHIEERYPRPASLRDGHEVTLRLMRPGDASTIVDFARSLPAADLLFLRRDVTQEAAVAEWIREIEVGSTFTVLGFDGDELLGEGDLHYSAADWYATTSARFACCSRPRRAAAVSVASSLRRSTRSLSCCSSSC